MIVITVMVAMTIRLSDSNDKNTAKIITLTEI